MTKKIKVLFSIISLICVMIVITGLVGCSSSSEPFHIYDSRPSDNSTIKWTHTRNGGEEGGFILTGTTTSNIGSATLPTHHWDSSYNGSSRYVAVADCAFSHYSGFTSVVIEYTYKQIGDYAFYYCDNLMEVTITDASIGGYAFYGCQDLRQVFIGEDVTVIGDHAFGECESIIDIYYEGSAVDWGSVYVGEGNECLTNAIRFYSETQPRNSSGHLYWHYVDGVIVNW